MVGVAGAAALELRASAQKRIRALNVNSKTIKVVRGKARMAYGGGKKAVYGVTVGQAGALST